MADIENVIKSIRYCLENPAHCASCDYDGCVFKHGGCREDLLADAMELLKEQEHKDIMFYALEDDWKRLKELLKEKETTSTVESRLFHCKKCGYGIDDIYLSNEHDFDIYPHYCPNCGRRILWDA